ncbi:hypothetical protein GGS20DRAFT_452775 [Poronia punctata]|nr:hypothetical protein GGS20DRAFT_452775 [Poronia punctata]
MQSKIILSTLFLAAVGVAQDLDVDDVPRACRDSCRNIATLSNRCGDETDNNRAERDCLCNAENAEQHGNSCAACVKAEYGRDDDDDGDDLIEIFELCGWNYRAVNPAQGGGSSSSSSSSSESTSTTATVTTSVTTVPGTTSTGTVDGTAVTNTVPPTTVTVTGPAPTETEDGGNAAAGLSAGLGLLAAGLMAAL